MVPQIKQRLFRQNLYCIQNLEFVLFGAIKVGQTTTSVYILWQLIPEFYNTINKIARTAESLRAVGIDSYVRIRPSVKQLA